MGTVVLSVPAKPKPRKIVLEIYRNHQKLFVINEIRIVFGLILLDKFSLKQEGFRLVFRLDNGNFKFFALPTYITCPKRSFIRYTPED